MLDNTGKPQQVYHDNEGSFGSTEFIILLNEHKVKQIIVSTKAPFAERAVQTIKNMIHARTEGLDLPVEKCVEMLPAILRKCNNKKHSTTCVTPNEAKREDNKSKVWLKIKNKAELNRKFPPLSVCSFVRIYETPKHKKGYTYVWSSKVYRITLMNENGYLIDECSKTNVVQRNGLLKTDGNEDKEG